MTFFLFQGKYNLIHLVFNTAFYIRHVATRLLQLFENSYVQKCIFAKDFCRHFNLSFDILKTFVTWLTQDQLRATVELAASLTQCESLCLILVRPVCQQETRNEVGSQSPAKPRTGILLILIVTP